NRDGEGADLFNGRDSKLCMPHVFPNRDQPQKSRLCGPSAFPLTFTTPATRNRASYRRFASVFAPYRFLLAPQLCMVCQNVIRHESANTVDFPYPAGSSFAGFELLEPGACRR